MIRQEKWLGNHLWRVEGEDSATTFFRFIKCQECRLTPSGIGPSGGRKSRFYQYPRSYGYSEY